MGRRKISTADKLKKYQYWHGFYTLKTEHINFLKQNSPESRQFQIRMNKVAREFAQECLNSLKDIAPNGPKLIQECKIRLDWGMHRKGSKGGNQMISMSMIRATTPYSVVEYTSFNNDPEIGFYDCHTCEDHLKCTVAHEIAHMVQYWTWKTDSLEMRKSNKPHGHIFKKLYRHLRVNLLNGKQIQKSEYKWAADVKNEEENGKF